MPVFSVASNESYLLKLDFYLTDNTTTVFFKVLRCGNQSFPEIVRIMIPPNQTERGWNSINIAVPSPADAGMKEAGIYMLKVVGAAGHSSGSWDSTFEDGVLSGRRAEDLSWDSFEVAYQLAVKVGGEYKNPFIRDLSLTPEKLVLSPEEYFTVRARYYRTYYCPSDYFKILIRNKTGYIMEAGRWAAGYWQMVPYGWQTFTLTVKAPSKPGNYTIKVVGCSGHGTRSYFGVNWNDPRVDGGFRGHKPEELSWDLYEVASEFNITVGGGVDLYISKITPVQVVYNVDINGDGKIDLVRGKSTAVFVYVKGFENLSDDAYIDVNLTFEGRTYLGSSSVSWLKKGNGIPFLLVAPHTTGDQVMIVSVDPFNKVNEINEKNNDMNITVTVKDTAGLHISYFRVSGPYGEVNETEFRDTAKHGSEFIEATYPVAENELISDIREEEFYGTHIRASICTDPAFLSLWKWLVEFHYGTIYKIYENNRVVGIVPDKYFPYHYEKAVGIWCNDAKEAVLVGEGYWTTIAHEIGHSYGLDDEETLIPVDGYWVKQHKDVHGHCFMYKGSAHWHNFSNEWICNECFERLFKEFSRNSDPDQAVTFVGTLNRRNLSLKLARSYWLKNVSVERPFSGNASLTVVDWDDNEVIKISFGTFRAFVDPGGVIEMDETAFAFLVPYPLNTSKWIIKYKNITLAEFNPNIKLLHDAIDSIPDKGFVDNPEQRRKALHQKIDAVEKMLEHKDFKGAVEKLRNDIRDKIEKWLKEYDVENPLQLKKGEII
ncbi:MAG: hypothetical protein ACP5KV_07105, partial [Candidatus Methanomethylicaceae archaeon]